MSFPRAWAPDPILHDIVPGYTLQMQTKVKKT